MTIPRIVLTGGPCAGKTSALARIRARLQTYGRHVYTTSEASTIMLDGGARIAGAPAARQLLYQRGVLRITMAIEDALLAFARSSPDDAVLICDRGAMDGRAYISGDLWDGLLTELGHETGELRDRRYDAVIHLVTAAEGAERFFGNENNPGRYEDLDGARAVDRRLREAWTGHARHAIIDNSTDFDEKMRRVVAIVCGQVGVPGPGRWERKYLVRPAANLPVCQVLDIEQTYLENPDGTEARVRKCSVAGVCSYTHTRKKDIGEGRRIEIERPITLREYNDHLTNADPQRETIRKRRCVYPHAGLYFQLDHFHEPRADLWMMEVEVDDLSLPVPIPPFIEVEREVTGEGEYLNASLARK